MDQFVFRRYEKKYLLDEERCQILLQHIGGSLIADSYKRSEVNNLYFDTADFQLIRRSLEKPVYKEKLRLRCYGQPAADTMVFIELKKKYRKVVYKRRIKMSYSQAVAYLQYQRSPVVMEQITREIDWFINFYNDLQPAMYIGYQREAFVGKVNPDLRLTLDRNIIWRHDNLELSADAWGEQLLQPGQLLLEIKAPEALPLWLCHELDALQIFPVSFSKYGRAFEALLCQNKKILDRGVVDCA